MVDRLAGEGVVLEICPGSTVALSLYDDFAAHPFRTLHERGLAVTLNSDDPPFFETSIGREYETAQREFGLSDDELRQITLTALEAAFVDTDTRRALIARL